MYQRATLSDFLGERIVYRNLIPQDPALRDEALGKHQVPRKTEPAYAARIVELVQRAQMARGVSRSIARLLFLGDTRMNDATAATNLGELLPLHGLIVAERPDETPCINMETRSPRVQLMFGNRWAMVNDFLSWLEKESVPLDETTALLVDLDKTAFGARGRNDKIINAARVAAARRVIEEALGTLDVAAFQEIYDHLNQPAYHPFTADNQDYLVYICLMVVSEVYPAPELWADLGDIKTTQGVALSFAQFIARCHERRGDMPPALRALHDEVFACFQRGDPTPFKRFRYQEYLETIARMDALPDDTPPEVLWQREIVITGEVYEMACHLQERGVLTFGLSDKPDEASLPTPELAAQGFPPLHHQLMKVL